MQKEGVEKRKEKEQSVVEDRLMTRQGKKGIKGLNISVTGKLKTFGNRDELKAFICKKGGVLTSSLSAKVDYLIMNDPESDSAKVQKAQALGIEIITERQFNELSGRAFLRKGKALQRYCGVGGDVVIPKNVTSIAENAFFGCSNIMSVTIPDDVTSIGESAFRGCAGLSDADGYVIVRNILFDYIGTGGDIVIPDGVVRIDRIAFSGCSNLTSVTIPDSATSMGFFAFFGCKSLTCVTIPKGVTTIGHYAFSGCKNLTIHAPAGSYAEQYAKENNIHFAAE